MHVELRCYGEVRQVVGGKDLPLELPDGSTVSDLLRRLSAEYEDFDAENVGRSEIVVSVDGRNVKHLDGGATKLSDGASVSLSGSPMAE